MTTPRGPYRSGIKRRREIIDAASLVFARYGYAGSSLRQIADDVGVTAAAFTRHFGNKEGLLQAVIEHWERKTNPSSRALTASSTSVASRSSSSTTRRSRGSSNCS